jgi:phospholipase/carboxylesterase
MAHGTFDPVVDVRLGEETRKTLEARGYALTWRTYPMPHAVSPEEIADITSWLQRVL